MKRSLPKYLLHLVFWIGIWFYFFYFFSYNSPDRGYVIWFSSLLLPLTMAITYTAVYYLIPTFLLKKKYAPFALYSFYTLLGSAYFTVLVIYGCLIFYKKMDATDIPPMLKNFFFILILVYLVVIVVSFAYILREGFRKESQNRELQNKMLSAQLQFKEQELMYLKKQIHPHFLFNTLNTIYGMAMKQSENTPGVILKLSNLLDYILYQVEKPNVALKEEVEHILEYIELEKIRFRDTLRVELHVDNIDDSLSIAPMILVPLVENAFKHGRPVRGMLDIFLELHTGPGGLDFRISNSVDPMETKIPEHGMGLENLRKRLNLHYDGAHALHSEVKNGTYTTHLALPGIIKFDHDGANPLHHRG